MKQLVLAVLTSACMSAYGQVKLEEVVKPGTKLIYGVISDRGNYDFIVTVKDMKGSSFEWEMTAPINMKGEIIHTSKALKTAYKMYNYFQAETKTLDDQTMAVWLSEKMFKDITKGKDAVKVCMYNPLDEPSLMKDFQQGYLVIKVDGDGTAINDRFVKPAKKVKDKWIMDMSSGDYFTYYNSPALPIIVRLHTNFTITLKEVQTH